MLQLETTSHPTVKKPITKYPQNQQTNPNFSKNPNNPTTTNTNTNTVNAHPETETGKEKFENLYDDKMPLNKLRDQAVITLKTIDMFNDSFTSLNSFSIENDVSSKDHVNLSKYNYSKINNKYMNHLQELNLLENEPKDVGEEFEVADNEELIFKVIEQFVSYDYVVDIIKRDSDSEFLVYLKNFTTMLIDFRHKYRGFSESQIIENNINSYFNLSNINPRMIKSLLEVELDYTTLYTLLTKYFNLYERGSWKYIHYVVMFNAIKILAVFVHELKVDCEVQTDNGWTPLLLSCRLNDLSVTKYLIQSDVNINSYSEQRGSALHIAVIYKKFDLLEFLLKQGIDTHITDSSKKKAIEYTTDELFIEIIKNTKVDKSGIKLDAEDDNIQKEGSLMYLGPFLQYRERYFILNSVSGHFNRAHSKKEAENGNFSQQCKISTFQSVTSYSPLYAKNGFDYIKLVMSNDSLVLAIKDNSALNLEWLDALKKCMEIYKGREIKFMMKMSMIGNSNETKEREKALENVQKDQRDKADQDKANSNGNTSKQEEEQEFDISQNNENNDSLQDFKIERKIGSGSFGKVYLVTNKKNNQQYALKILNKKQLYNRNQIKYAISECNILKSCKFQFITRLYNAYQSDNNLYLVMDYCSGGDLSSILVKQEYFKEDEAKFYMCEVVLAIEYIHTKHILYRDMKPENILLDGQGHVKLADFGLSKENMTQVDLAYSFCGSPAYLAPEMIDKKGVGKSADIWGLGTLLYELLNGRPPFIADNIQSMFKKISNETIKMDYPVSAECVDLLKKMMDKDPTKRFNGNVGLLKKHPWFDNIDWNKVNSRHYSSPFNSDEDDNDFD